MTLHKTQATRATPQEVVQHIMEQRAKAAAPAPKRKRFTLGKETVQVGVDLIFMSAIAALAYNACVLP